MIGADPFGQATIKRSWDDGTETMENYKRRLQAAFDMGVVNKITLDRI